MVKSHDQDPGGVEWHPDGTFSLLLVTDPRGASKSSDAGKDPHAVALGRRGGRKGGHARAAVLTPEQRREIARNAALARWGRG